MAKAKKKSASKKSAPKKVGASKIKSKKPAAQKAPAKKKTASKTKAVKAKAPSKKTASKKIKANKKTAKPVAHKKTPQIKATASTKSNKAVVAFQKNLTPLDDRILVSVKGVEKKTPGGLIIPDTVADQSGNLQGFVVASGRGHLSKKGRIRPMDVHQGDQILFSEYSGTKVQLDGEDFVILRESDVLGIVQK